MSQMTDTEVLPWSYGLGARERQSCPFFGNDARFTGLAQAARRSIIAPTMLAGHMNWPSWSVPFYLLLLLFWLFIIINPIVSCQRSVQVRSHSSKQAVGNRMHVAVMLDASQTCMKGSFLDETWQHFVTMKSQDTQTIKTDVHRAPELVLHVVPA